MKAINVFNHVNEENYRPIVERVLKKAYKMMDVSKNNVINIIFVSSETMREYNGAYRGIHQTTDVLTFPSEVDGELGDVFISVHTAMEQARAYGHTFKRELGFLIVHGFLHALGYDHANESQEHVMFSLQEQILNKVKLFR